MLNFVKVQLLVDLMPTHIPEVVSILMPLDTFSEPRTSFDFAPIL